MILVDDGDRNAAQQLAEIGLRIEQAVDDGREDDEAEDAAIVEDATDFGEHRGPDAGRGDGVARRRLLSRPRGALWRAREAAAS